MAAFDDVSRRHAAPRTKNATRIAGSWQKPPIGMMKVNCDAAVDKERGAIGMGIIIGDSSGVVIVMHNGPKRFITNPFLAKAMAARTAIEFSSSLGFRNCILEGDAQEVINAINQPEPCMGAHGQLVNDIKFSLVQVGHWQVRHTGRDNNGVAHTLAKMALYLPSSYSWRRDFPACLEEIVRKEQFG